MYSEIDRRPENSQLVGTLCIAARSEHHLSKIWCVRFYMFECVVEVMFVQNKNFCK